MKWFAFLILALGIIVIWPRGDKGEEPTSSKEEISSSHRRSNVSRTTYHSGSRRDFSREGKADLEDQIVELWPEINPDLSARDPKVVRFIRILRELGKRDGPGALSILDQLDQTDKRAAWIQARMAVAGGWALSDPEAASQALLEEDHILPKDYNGIVIAPESGSISFLHQSINLVARQIFELWAQEAPDKVKKAASIVDGSPAAIKSQLITVSGLTSFINRNSIDDILNNPNRSAPRPEPPLTDEMKNLGEPAFTQEEWAARNPELAREMITKAYDSDVKTTFSLVLGLARAEDDYGNLIALVRPDQRLALAISLTPMSQPIAQEMAWLLDGRETTWTLTPEQRQEAVDKLLESSVLTDTERETLANFKLPALPGAFSRPSTGIELEVRPPELPNKE
jgi:hypothetical protein